MRFIFIALLYAVVLDVQILAQDQSKGKISGLVYADYFYNILRDSTIQDIPYKAQFGTKDLNGFAFRRIYFTYDYKISDKFSSRFRLESQSFVDVNNTLFLVYIKDAYLNWKDIFDGSNLIFGIQPPPTFTVSESFWEYRSLEKTIMDLRRIATSRDFGLSLKGNLMMNGKVNYWVMVANGTTIGEEGDKYKRIYAHLDFVPEKDLQITIYGDYRFKPRISYNGYLGNFNNDALVSSLFIGYKKESSFSINLESFIQTTYNDMIETQNSQTVLTNRNAFGLSLFGWYRFEENITGVLRYDYFDPNISEYSKGDARNFVVAGVDFKLEENVSVIPNIEFETYQTPVNGISIEPSLTGRLTLSYNF